MTSSDPDRSRSRPQYAYLKISKYLEYLEITNISKTAGDAI